MQTPSFRSLRVVVLAAAAALMAACGTQSVTGPTETVPTRAGISAPAASKKTAPADTSTYNTQGGIGVSWGAK
jgi:outer membrane biogenesis lipoprotein LolB